MMKKSFSLSFMLLLLRVGLGLFFLYTSVLKFGDLPTTAAFLTRSMILPEFFSFPLTCIGVVMEFIVGLGLLFRCYYQGISLWAVVMSSTFLALFMQAWLRGLDLSCNCTGTNAAIESYPLEVGYRLLLLAVCLLLFWDASRQDGLPQVRKKLDFSDA